MRLCFGWFRSQLIRAADKTSFNPAQFFTGANFQMLASTNVALPTSNWPAIGPATGTPPGSGQFQFIDPQATNLPRRFYRVKTP